MNVPYFFARHYFFSSKLSSVIHVISGISLAGITVGTAAMIIILSVFNGFESLLRALYSSFDSSLKVQPLEGKYFKPQPATMAAIAEVNGVLAVTGVIEENVLIRTEEAQTYATMKAVEAAYFPTTGIDSMVRYGRPKLYVGDKRPAAILGNGVASNLNMSVGYMPVMTVYLPNKFVKRFTRADRAFTARRIATNGVFSIQQEFDAKYMLVPMDFAREITKEAEQVTSIEINLENGADEDAVKATVEELFGAGFEVKNRYQQHELLYNVMKSEKLVVYLILTFVLLIAAFNMIGALLMLAIHKRKDIAVLKSLGADAPMVRRVLIYLGLMLSLVGGAAGILIGALVCWGQILFGWITLPGGQGTLVISSYPVDMQTGDFVLVGVTVLVVGSLASIYPARIAYRQISPNDLNQ